MPEVFIALGSNLGNRRANLRRAAALLPPDVEVLAASALYQSAALPADGIETQPAFYNAVVRGETALDPLPLLDRLQRIESRLGRRRGPRWGPRVVDLDLLLYDDRRLESERLTLPHPRLAERPFVLRPLLDLRPSLILPGGTDAAAALARLGSADLVRLEGPVWLDA
jgi:2-amino-4-hydroxy-6-hydroxymethyldihydropteridine diphosphokinase